MESAYQRKVIKKYKALGYYCIKLAKTNKNGIPDLICLKPDHVIFIEAKGNKTVYSPLQQLRKRELQKLGFSVLLDRNAVNN